MNIFRRLFNRDVSQELMRQAGGNVDLVREAINGTAKNGKSDLDDVVNHILAGLKHDLYHARADKHFSL